MPTLELYPAPAASARTNKRLTIAHATTAFVPSHDTDIFRSKLPTHSTSSWTAKRAETPKSTASSSDTSKSPPRNSSNERAESHGDALLLPERSSNLRDLPPPPSPALTPAKRSNEKSARDWRYEAVSIESIEMEPQTLSKGAKSAVTGLHTKAVYQPSDPKTTDVGFGVIHLYRDSEESVILGDDYTLARPRLDKVAASRSASGHSHGHAAEEDAFPTEDCTTLSILAVPSWMMPSDLLGFVGDQAREEVSHFRLIRTGRANKYMVLMKFRSAKKAKEWQANNNGRLFSAAEPENCHVVFIKSVEFLTPDEDVDGHDGSSFPGNMNDPFTPARVVSGGMARSASKSLTSKPLAPPPPNLRELPTCPVCLERMDETTGLLTILCQHVFHCACLEKWRGSGCPVCRYTHSPSYTFPYPRPDGTSSEDDADQFCRDCNINTNLWVCLICGNLGCGRYDGAHARAHYEETSHCYSMNITSQHVWDYAGDGYVHRLIQSKQDTSGNKPGDVATQMRHENEAFRAEGADSVPREKMESMATEYTYLLTSQLEGQRRYFEEQVERSADKAAKAASKASTAEQTLSDVLEQLKDLKTHQEDSTTRMNNLETSLAKSLAAKERFEKLSRTMTSQLQEEKIMTVGLLARIKAADEKVEAEKQKVEAAAQEVKELQESNQDLMGFLSGQAKVEVLREAGVEVDDGSVGLVQGGKGKGRKKK
ncbi:hypothetical protein LTR78_004082 [Recurvomyces mirabilis]|uniref:Zf-UBP-domain-containing protein n=1 Tax=Recurvomyces mirabilis TaxID=574656 RepID=A0AAE0WQ38_9PEZI|nr:hypothetical protein LTR78_004082 [Recurvomyces mirabilis]